MTRLRFDGLGEAHRRLNPARSVDANAPQARPGPSSGRQSGEPGAPHAYWKGKTRGDAAAWPHSGKGASAIEK